MENDKQSFVFYCDWLEVFKNEECSREDIIELLEACVNFVKTGQTSELKNPFFEGAFIFMRNAIARDTAKYEDKRKKRKESGQKGGIQKQINRSKKNKENISNEKPDYDSIYKLFLAIGGTEREVKEFIEFNDNNNWSFNGYYEKWEEAAEAWHKMERNKPGKNKHSFTDMALTHNWDFKDHERQLLNQQIVQNADDSRTGQSRSCSDSDCSEAL